MKIYLEPLLFIFAPIIIFIFWYLWNGWSKKRLLKKYDPKKDLGKLAEDKRKEEIEIHNGKENKTVGRESFRELGSSRRRDSGRSSSLNQESIVPSRGSELSSDSSTTDNESVLVSDSTRDEKKKRLRKRIFGRR